MIPHIAYLYFLSIGDKVFNWCIFLIYEYYDFIYAVKWKEAVDTSEEAEI